MDGYYDHHPLVQLEKPVALAGYLTQETRVVGYRLAALLGLPSIDLDRRIEHQSGRSVWRLLWDESEARYRQLERQELRRAVRERPCGILSLGDGALMDEENRDLLLAHSHLVAIDLDLANTYWRFKAHEQADSAFWHPLYPGPLDRIEQVRPFWQARAPHLKKAQHHVDLQGRDKGDVVTELEDLVKRLAK